MDAVTSVVTNCGQQDQFELAKSLAAFASKEFGSPTAKSRLAALQEISSEIEAREQLFNEYQAALETLKTSKDDPEANQKVGQYLCFVRGQWDQGLGPLALGADAELRSAAVRELASQSGPTDAMAVADSWYGIADRNKWFHWAGKSSSSCLSVVQESRTQLTRTRPEKDPNATGRIEGIGSR